MSRSIPVGIRRKLRKEVNYGCPVPGCGSPYLSYHHFDPPFHDGGTHNPIGMIALCLPHHKFADIGTYTDEQLREFKRNPYLNGQNIKGRIEWMRREIVLQSSGLQAFKPNIFLQIKGKPIIWVTRCNQGMMLLNIDISRPDGSSLLRIIDNDWEVTGPISELEAVPSGRSIHVSSPKDGFELFLKFEDLSRDKIMNEVKKQIIDMDNLMLLHFVNYPKEIKDLLLTSGPSIEDTFTERWKSIDCSISSWPALLVCMKGRLSYPFELLMKEDEMVLPGNNILRGNTAINCNVGLSIS